MIGWLALLFGVFAVGAAGGGGSSGTGAATEADDADDAGGASDGGTETSAMFLAEGGALVLEAESGAASGSWREIGMDGERGMLWDADGNSYKNADPDEALTFEFVTEEAGTYMIALHAGRVQAAQNAGDVRDDTGNDAWIEITDIETGEVLVEATKLFTHLGERDRELRWGDTFDKDDEKWKASVDLEAGRAYRLEVMGRSDGHVIDRITLSNDGALKDTGAPESGLMEFLSTEIVEEAPAEADADEDAADAVALL